MNDNSNDDINSMAKYFVHSSQIQDQSQNQNENNNLGNLIYKELTNSKNMKLNMNNMDNNINPNMMSSQMNSSFESTMTNQANLNNEIMSDLMGGDYQDKKLVKLIRSFKKKIKLRNATKKKNFWKQDYISSKLINVKISSLFPTIEPTQGFCLCIYNYMNNKQFKELICKVENEIIDNKNNNNIIEKYTVINQDENQLNNLLINPISYLDNNKHRKDLIKLISSIYYRIKSLKIELGKSKENYIFNYLVLKSKLMNSNRPYIYGKLYSIFPNINFQLNEINKLSLSSRFKLNKLLISKHHTNIQNEKGEQLTNGFITMSNEKRIITLTDDTNKKELQESQSLKQIIFGIWLSLKFEDVSNYNNVEELVNKHKHLIYRKCLEFVLASPKIETIFSPSPDEGIFLLILFFKTSQSYFEVKIIPNEEDKCFKEDTEENKFLERFSNEWLIRTQKFDFINNNGQFLFNFQRYANRNKVCSMNDFITTHLNSKKQEKNMDNYNNNNYNNMNANVNMDRNNFNNSQMNTNNNYNSNMNNNMGYNMNNYENSQMNNDIQNNMYNNNFIKMNMNMNNNINNMNNMNNINNLNRGLSNQNINNINNNFNTSIGSGFNASQGYQESNYNKDVQYQKKTKIIPNNESKNIINKQVFDPLTDIFEHNNNDINNSSNPSSNNNVPYIKKNSFQQSQSLYNTNNNNPKTSYNPNEYLKMGQMNINQQQIYNQELEDNQNNNISENENMISNRQNLKKQINENNKILNNIGSMYGEINDQNLLNSNLGGLNLPVNNQKMNNKMNIMENNNQNIYGQIMMNNNINNTNSNRDEMSQQSNTNYSQYTLGKKAYSFKNSQSDSNTGNNNQNININNSNKNLNQLNIDNNNFENDNNINSEEYQQMTPSMSNYNKYSHEMTQEQRTFNISRKINFSNDSNNYSKTNPNLYNYTNISNQYETIYSQGGNAIQKEDKATQTINDDKTSLYNNSQKQSLSIIIKEQTKNMEMLQNKVNNLEELLAKVKLLLKRKNEKENINDSDISNDNENENDESFNNKSKSESLKNSGNNSKENITINKENINGTNNNKSNVNKINIKDDSSNDNLYKIKNVSNFVDSNNKLYVMDNKNILSNEDSEDNDLSSDLNVSDSRNSKELNKSENAGDKTIEIPKIKYNSALLNSNNDDTENNISSN